MIDHLLEVDPRKRPDAATVLQRLQQLMPAGSEQERAAVKALQAVQRSVGHTQSLWDLHPFRQALLTLPVLESDSEPDTA